MNLIDAGKQSSPKLLCALKSSWHKSLNLFFIAYIYECFPLLTFLRIQVANFCNAEDDGSFWSRWIKPESVVTAEVKIRFSIRIWPPLS